MAGSGSPKNAVEEATRKTKIFREWKGCFTQASRNAIPEDRFYDLLNLMPIGPANLHSLPAPFVTSFSLGIASNPDSIYWGQYANLNGVDYLYLFGTSGAVYQYNENTDTTKTIAPAGTLGGKASRCTQWKNTVVLFIDSTGYYSWNGTTFLKLSNGSNGAPSFGTDIAVCFGRVFIVQGRVLLYSAVDDYGLQISSLVTAWTLGAAYAIGAQVVNLQNGNVYVCATNIAAAATAPTGTGTGIVDDGGTWNFVGTDAWTTSNGSSFINLTDPKLRSTVTRLWAANGYLYIIGTSSVFVIADMYVPIPPPTPPLPVFSLTNVDPIYGTDQPGSVFDYGRDLMFASREGALRLSGVEVDRISQDIDGTFQFVDFTKPLFGGAAVINKILVGCFLINQLNDPVIGNRNVLAVYFDGKWFFSNALDTTGAPPAFYARDPIMLIIPCLFNNQPTIYAIMGIQGQEQFLVRMFDNYAQSPPSSFMTALWPLDDPLADKQVIRAGFEAEVQQVAVGFTATIDTPNSQTPFTPTTQGGIVSWVNNSGQTVQWQNGASQIVQWFTPGLFLYNAVTPYVGGKYVGMSFSAPAAGSGIGETPWAPVYELSGVYLDVEMRARW